MSTLLFSWYARNMFVKECSVSQQDRDDLNLLAKVVCYSKLFMPAGTILDSKPPPSSIDDCRRWDIAMRALGAVVEGSMMSFIDKYNGVTHRTKKPFVQGVIRHLQKIPITEFPTVSVIDRTCTLLTRNNMWFYNNIVEFKK